MPVIDLYSVPILVETLSSKDQFTQEEVDLLKGIPLEKQYGDTGNFLSVDSCVLDTYNLSRIKSLCDIQVSNYTRNILGISDRFKMFRSWLSKNIKGTKHDIHSHRNTMISCVLYFDEYMSTELMAPINFYQEGLDQIFKTFQFSFNTVSRNQYNNKVLTVYPKTNMLIIFPGWIKHETETANTSIERYCLGTNYFFEGRSSTGYHDISIDIS